MSEFLNIIFPNDRVSVDLQLCEREFTKSRSIFAALGKRAEKVFKTHFAEKNTEPNKMNWPARGFWNQIRRACSLAEVTDTSSTVVDTNPALNLKIFGGHVTAKRAGALAIPATAAAYAAGSPREVMGVNFHVVQFKGRAGNTVGALVESPASTISIGKKRKDGSQTVKQTGSILGIIWYWLVKAVTVPKDPTALPPMPRLQSELNDELTRWRARFAQRIGGAR